MLIKAGEQTGERERNAERDCLANNIPPPPCPSTSSVNFQPAPNSRSQDRWVVRQFEINGGLWSLTGVFDGAYQSYVLCANDLKGILTGHLGDVTVDHVSKHLPIIVSEFLQDAFNNERSRLSDPAFISDCFSRSILAFDDAIANDVLKLFGGVEGLAGYSDEQIRHIINDQHNGGLNYQRARLNMYGTTALVALVDPDHQNLWIANLGDCQATLVTPKGHGDWDIRVLTRPHNGDNVAEVERVRREHANEPECVIDRRVLGALHPFRCKSDFLISLHCM